MTKDELNDWALANGWRTIEGHASLTKPSAHTVAIVRLVLKATMANLEIKKPTGKWERISSQSYSKIEPDPDSGIPGGLGLATIAGLTSLMRSNKDAQVFATFATPKR